MTKTVIILPFYEIKSDEVKTMLNVKDDRTVLKILQAAGVHIRIFGTKKVVLLDDLIEAAKPIDNQTIGKYRPKSELSKSLNHLDD